ncbi:MAG: helix-turn-helix transcriptional regulator [Clostridiales bacterium]|nr:helix-turn-helix transcriptional regulator [Clostridiales bacterium]
MDQIKIGKFIAECRKKQGLTQLELADKLCVTDRAVSKWENGKSMPDSSIMIELCNILNISVNDLLCGEVVTMDDHKEKLDKTIIEMVKQKEDNDKKLLSLEILIGILSMIILLGFTISAAYIEMADWLKVCLIVSGFIICFIGIYFAIKIEQTAGYYKCAKCGNKYVPSFNKVLFAMHFGRTRYMKCPKCGKKSWQKKVISKE